MKWQRYIALPLVLVLLTGAYFSWRWYSHNMPTKQGICKLRRVAFPLDRAGSLSVRFYATTTDKPEAIKDAPAGLSSRARFFVIDLPQRELAGCIDERDKALVVYVDANANGLLSDEKRLQRRRITLRAEGEKWKFWRFGPAPLKAASDRPDAIEPFFLISQSPQYVQIQPIESYAGKIRIGDKVHEVVLMDSDYDGQYATIFSPDCVQGRWPNCDSMAFDYDRDGRFMHVSFRSVEEVPLSRLLRVDGQYYAVHLSEDMRRLTLSKAEPEFGTVQFSIPDTQALLWSDAFSGYVTASDGTYSLPVGRYSAYCFKARVKVEQNDWEMSSSYETGRLKDFEIKPGETTRLDFGPPFTAKVDVSQQAPQVSLDLKLYGSSGEMYRPNVQKNGKAVEAPSFSIVAEDGTVLETGRFKYG